MSAKFFQKQIRPDIINGDVSTVIQSDKTDLPFAAGDVVFDWQALDLPKGTDAIVNGSVHMYGEDGGPSTSKDFYLLIAKSNNGVAPTSLGTTNAAVTGCYELGDILLGVIKFEGNTHGQGIINLNKESIYYYNIGSSSGQSGVIVIEGGINPSGITNGSSTQRIYVAGIAGGAHDFSTGVLADGAITSDSATSITTKTVDPRKAFRVGDTVYLHDVDTALGTIASMTATNITLNAAIAGGTNIANNDEFMNAKPITIKLGFRNPR